MNNELQLRDPAALNSALSIADDTSRALHYKMKRNTLSAACAGHRVWPEKLTPEAVASWIVANVGYASPFDAHEILEAMIFESLPKGEIQRKVRKAFEQAGLGNADAAVTPLVAALDLLDQR